MKSFLKDFYAKQQCGFRGSPESWYVLGVRKIAGSAEVTFIDAQEKRPWLDTLQMVMVNTDDIRGKAEYAIVATQETVYRNQWLKLRG